MNWITLACEILALWSLGRIGYFRAFPLFYAKLAVVTVAYSLQNPLSETWWDQWWAPFQVVIVILMIGSAIEAYRRLVRELPSSEDQSIAAALIFIGGIVAGICLLGLRGQTDPTIIMSAISFATESALTVAMAAMLGYQWYSPFRHSRTAGVHFWLLTQLNLSCCAVDVLFKLMSADNEIEWNVAHAMFTCAYCTLLVLWAFEVPRVIRNDASSRHASPAHPAPVN